MGARFSAAAVVAVFRALHRDGIAPEIAGPARGMSAQTARRIGEGQAHPEVIGCASCDGGGYWVWLREEPGERYWVRGRGGFVGGLRNRPQT